LVFLPFNLGVGFGINVCVPVHFLTSRYLVIYFCYFEFSIKKTTSSRIAFLIAQYTTRYAIAIAEMKIIAFVMDWLRYRAFL